MTYNQQARELLDELNLRGKLNTEHYSIIEAALNEMEARAEEVESKAKALESAITDKCSTCKNAPRVFHCEHWPRIIPSNGVRACEHWEFDYERFKEVS